MSPPIIAVFGATGTQGSAVVDALLSDATFTPRAITRKPTSEKALALKARGAEIAQADIWDKESIKKAIAGCEGVFGITDFFDPTIYPNNLKGEIEQGKNLVDASSEVGIKFFVWSSLPGCAKISKGTYQNIVHFDNKAAIEEYLRSSGVPNATVLTAWFTEDLWKFGALAKTSSGFELAIPKYSASADQSFTWVARDLGPCVLALFKNRDRKEINNKAFPVVTAKMTYPEFAKILEKSLGKEVKFVSPPTSGSKEFDEMYEYLSTIGFYDTPVPNPDLLALGVTFGTLEEFAETEVKARFA
jgi:uncharacterized protein YbjT (DUF2867 family)